MDNYRPISVLPTVSKVIERAAHTQLYAFLESHQLLVRNQFGFRRGRSTPLALTQFTDEMLTNMDNGLLNGVIFLDLKKALDTVDHTILMTVDHTLLRTRKLVWRGISFSSRDLSSVTRSTELWILEILKTTRATNKLISRVFARFTQC